MRLHPRACSPLAVEIWPPSESCLLVCDVWDRHWCPTASARVAELALSIDLAVKAARKAGFLIVHAPANCMEFYEGTEMRNRAREAPLATPPIQLTTTERFGTTWCWPDDSEPPLPIDDSDGGCDCDAGSTPVDACVWTRQADTIAIEASDAITESAQELYNLLVHRGVKRVLICGVHLNMCVLGRGYGIRQLVRLGFTVRLISDLTDTMYSGASRSPYVSHLRGTELVINHVERHWCASILSTDVTGRPPFRFRGAEVALQADGLWPAADSSSLAADPSTSSPAGRGGTCSCACDRSERHGWSIVAIAFLVDALALGGRGIFSVALLYFEAEWAWERTFVQERVVTDTRASSVAVGCCGDDDSKGCGDGGGPR